MKDDEDFTVVNFREGTRDVITIEDDDSYKKGFRFQEAPVRKKSERQKLPGRECAECASV